MVKVFLPELRLRIGHLANWATQASLQKIFLTQISDQVFFPRIDKERLQLYNKKTQNPRCKTFDRYFTREDTQMANKHVKSYSIPLVTEKHNLKPQWDSLTYHLKRWLWKRSITPNVRRDMEKLELLFISLC